MVAMLIFIEWLVLKAWLISPESPWLINKKAEFKRRGWSQVVHIMKGFSYDLKTAPHLVGILNSNLWRVNCS